MSDNNFNPSGAADLNAGIYGLPHDSESAAIVLIPVEWEVTVSYGTGACEGPDEILKASYQMDLCHHDFPQLWKAGIWLDTFPEDLRDLQYTSREKALKIIDAQADGIDTAIDEEFAPLYQDIQDSCEKLNNWLEERVAFWKSKGKTVGVVGGDHSSPFGYYKHLSKSEDSFGMLVIDAHMDLRNAYEGFRYSHASIFYNTLQLENISKMVQVGIRDYCHEELDFVKNNEGKIEIFFDRDNRVSIYEGLTWRERVNQIVESLPDRVYISVDIDGLDPKLCPNTGTPVPGGMEFEEVIYLINAVFKSGRKIIGFDLCEVAGNGIDEWDGNVGARILYQLCGVAYYSMKNA